jgi:hypothetical protein
MNFFSAKALRTDSKYAEINSSKTDLMNPAAAPLLCAPAQRDKFPMTICSELHGLSRWRKLVPLGAVATLGAARAEDVAW